MYGRSWQPLRLASSILLVPSHDKELKVVGPVMMPLMLRTEIDDPEVGTIKLAADIEAITECAKSL